MDMHNPARPGEILADWITDLRLADALGTNPGYWLRMQAQYDLWQARQHDRPTIDRLAA